MSHFPHITIENGVFHNSAEMVQANAKVFAIITDVHLKKQGETLRRELQKKGCTAHLIVLAPGEGTKSFATIDKLAATLLRLKLKRDACLIGLGGGVIGDVTGFLSSIYLRGISFVLIPTTLLAMADSSMGGKNGVNFGAGKNLLGTFYHPVSIIMDPLLLNSLPTPALRDGFAEIIKHSIIADRGFFDFLKKNREALLKKNPMMLKKAIERSAKIKMNIVKKDERESIKKTSGGRSRMLLNYGHTVGHALEKLSDYTLSHGQAVAIGMVAENRVATGKKLLSPNEAQKILELLTSFGLPTKIPSQYSDQQIAKALEIDKKHIEGKLYFALPTKIGKAKVVPV